MRSLRGWPLVVTVCLPGCREEASALAGTSARLTLAPAELDGGDTVVGSLSRHEITLSSIGDAVVSLRDVRVDGDDAFVVETAPAVLPPGETGAVTLVFA